MTRFQPMNPAIAGPAASAAMAPFDNLSEAVHAGFWQRRFVQNVLPFLTSLSVHAGIVVIGLLMYTAIKVIHAPARQEQINPAAFEMVQANTGIPQFPGLSNLPKVEPLQDRVPNDQSGASFDRGHIPVSPDGGGAPDEAALITVGPNGGFSHAGNSIGTSDGNGPNGDAGPLARVGSPRIGGGTNPIFCSSPGAHRIAFVCDASGSMINKMASLKMELQKAVTSLRISQSFSIIFFQNNTRPDMLSDSLLQATPLNVRKAGTFLEGVTATGTTDPIPGIEAAFRQNPELIFLLTDGDFPDNDAVLSKIRSLNKAQKVRINTIAFVGVNDNDTAFLDLLKTIARENGGKFRHVSEDSGEVKEN